MAIAQRGGRGGRAGQDGLEHLFPRLPGGVRACEDDLEPFFFHVCPFDRGGSLKLFG